MAKEVDLTKRVTPQMPTPPKKVARPDPSGMRTPPPANAPPMNVGQVVEAKPSGPPLTPMERAALERQGWKPGQPIPREISQVAQAIQAEAGTYRPPIDPNTPPLIVETVDISQLDPTKAAEITSVLNNIGSPQSDRPVPQQRAPNLQGVLRQPPAAAQAPPQRQAAAPPMTRPAVPPSPDVSIGSQAIPGWKPPGQPFYQPSVPNPRAFENPGRPAEPPPQAQPEYVVEVDMPAAQQEYAPPEEAAQILQDYATAQAPVVEEPVASTFSGPTLTNCPHCAWPLDMADIPEPEYGEKQSFLQAVLGQKPFIKDYTVLGGAVVFRFRTLTTKEIDVIYGQVLWEREQGLIPSFEDYWEKINRYRLFLQTCKFVATSAFNFDLPDGYSAEANPYAEAYWKFDPSENPRDTALPQIETYMVNEVFRTEPIMRIAHMQCGQFNRLVAKLEAMVDNSDFWQPTEAQS